MTTTQKSSFFLLLLLFTMIVSTGRAQTITQTVRGKILDQDTRTPLPGANVIVVGSEDFLGASTDEQGEFRIENVPLGRITLSVTYLGYEERLIPNILVTSGKEVVLDFTLRESMINMDEVVISATKDKSKVANEMALVSARGFTVEETKRYAGSFNDPARMVAAYAGVETDPSGDNAIIVRGNSPKGILWRLEGIEIPNPNHFSDEGATGGPINALNSQMLDNSEFYTGAFAPEFGNALSGVFDMQLRKGNNENREYSFSLGALGIEAALEGPLKKGSKSSYLVNYRYSSLALLDNIGLVDFGGVPKYQDLSFKVHVPTKSFGTLSIFGLGGKSNILEEEFEEDNDDILVEKADYHANMGVVGVTQYLPVTQKGYFQNSISVSQNGSGFLGYEPNDQRELIQLEDADLNKNTIKGATTFNYKFNARHTVQAGFIYTHHFFDFYYNYFDKALDEFVTEQDASGDAGHIQNFVSWKFRMKENLSLVAGYHNNSTTINSKMSFEPRAALRWEFHPTQALSAGFGIHGKMESLTNYYGVVRADDGREYMPNKDIGFSKARHYVVGYENRLTPNLFFKAEVYYQQLFNIPVENDINSSYSLVNQDAGFSDRALVNEGTGKNMGVEITLERYFADNYYFMATASLYDSKYEALDGVERNSQFNGNYVGNIMGGKEFELNTSGAKKRTIGFNAKISLLGGRRYTPIDLEASIEKDATVFQEDKAFTKKGDDIFIANFAVTYRVDSRKISQELKLDIQNATNNNAKLRQFYNGNTDKIEYMDQLPLLPVIMYTIHF